eukprot:4252919-Alexandrium_andersonii.AAC.1
MWIPGIRAGPTAARITGRVAFRLSAATQTGLEGWATSLGRAEGGRRAVGAAPKPGAAGRRNRKPDRRKRAAAWRSMKGP